MRRRIAADGGIRMSRQEAGSSVGARGVSFENRIAISALVTAVVVLVTASALFIVEQWQSGQIDLRRNQSTLTQVVANQLATAVARGDAAAAPGDPRRGGGPPCPEPAADPPDGGQPAVTGDDADPAATLPGLREPGPGIEQDRLVAALAPATVQPAGMR